MLLFQDKVQKFHIPKLAKNLYLNDEPINIISDTLKDKMIVKDRVIISKTCFTVNKEMASAFIKNEDISKKNQQSYFYK